MQYIKLEETSLDKSHTVTYHKRLLILRYPEISFLERKHQCTDRLEQLQKDEEQGIRPISAIAYERNIINEQLVEIESTLVEIRTWRNEIEKTYEIQRTKFDLKIAISELLQEQAYPTYIPFIPKFCPQCEKQPDLSHLPIWCQKCGGKMQDFPEITWKNYIRKDPKYGEIERFRKVLFTKNGWDEKNNPFTKIGMKSKEQRGNYIYYVVMELEKQGL